MFFNLPLFKTIRFAWKLKIKPESWGLLNWIFIVFPMFHNCLPQRKRRLNRQRDDRAPVFLTLPQEETFYCKLHRSQLLSGHSGDLEDKRKSSWDSEVDSAVSYILLGVLCEDFLSIWNGYDGSSARSSHHAFPISSLCILF